MKRERETGSDHEPPRVVGVRAEHRADGLGLGVARPRISWRTETSRPAWMQAAFEIRVLDDVGEDVADQGWVASVRIGARAVAGRTVGVAPAPGGAGARRRRRRCGVRLE